MNFPKIPNEELIKKLEPPKGKINMVLDTDTFNEIDDQFAVVHALLSKEKLNVEAIYAAPFHNKKSSGPEDGMEKSYQEILRLLKRLNVSPDSFVYKGSPAFLPAEDKPVPSEAAKNLVKRALAVKNESLYVVAIGAITNVASAILLEPKIIEKIVVVWLGGMALHWHTAKEFNLKQDIHASRLIFDCGVPLVHIPVLNVTSHLLLTVAEMEAHVKGKGPIGDYLMEIFSNYPKKHYASSKVIWDISVIAYLLDNSWIPTNIVHSPILTDQLTWSFDNSRHFIRTAYFAHRDMVFKDFFDKLREKK